MLTRSPTTGDWLELEDTVLELVVFPIALGLALSLADELLGADMVTRSLATARVLELGDGELAVDFILLLEDAEEEKEELLLAPLLFLKDDDRR